MARTVEPGYFGSVGMGDPMSSFAERTLRVAWDFSKKNVPENKIIPLMNVPKGLCIDRISVIQTKKTILPATVTFGMKSEDSATIGGNFALSNTDTLLRSSQDADATNKTSVFVTGDDVLCLIMPSALVSAWQASHSYTAGDLVKSDGIVYSSKTTRTSGSGTFDATEKANWDVVSDTAGSLIDGSFDLCIHGFEAFSEGTGAGDGSVYRPTLQTANNVSGGQWPLD